MAKLNSRVARITKKMESENKVTTLSFDKSSDLDHQLATEFKKIKKDFELREKNSRAYVAELELSSFNR